MEAFGGVALGSDWWHPMHPRLLATASKVKMSTTPRTPRHPDTPTPRHGAWVASRILGPFRVGISIGLLVVACSKLLGKHSESYAISSSVYYASAALEVVIAGLLLANLTGLAATLLCLLSGGGILVALTFPNQDCGCLLRTDRGLCRAFATGCRMLSLVPNQPGWSDAV